jgi:hypothetical protein
MWLVNGDFYRDHAHEDNGNLVIYALGAPLSIDWGSMYSPQVPRAFMHSVVVPENTLRSGWAQDNTPLSADGFRWQNATQQAFESFSASAHARSTYNSSKGMTPPNGVTWTRSIYSIHPDENHPILIIRDSFTGRNANTDKISTLNLMAQDEVDTPQGPLSPPFRRYSESKGLKQLPSAGPVLSLPAGLNRFGFTGQWLIDCNLYTFGSQPMQVTIGSWSHDWHPNREQGEFAKANERPFEETQYIFRVRGTNEFGFLLAPYRKGRRPETDVRMNGSEIVVKRNNSTTTFDDHCYSYTDSQSTILTAYGQGLCKASGISIQGGSAEVRMENDRVGITAHGAPGLRTISLPGSWNPKPPITRQQSRYVVNYKGGGPETVALDPL